MAQTHNCLAIGTVAGALASAALLNTPSARAATETVVYAFQSANEGEIPEAGLLVLRGGALVGTTAGGGASTACFDSGCGTVFSVDPGKGKEAVLYSFRGGDTDGGAPEAGLINVNGMLYGTTAENGAHGHGTVFSVNPITGKETVMHAFSGGADGAYPYAGLINVNGTLFGTTSSGGGTTCPSGGGCGTVFAINP